jgi:hypothetical protein
MSKLMDLRDKIRHANSIRAAKLAACGHTLLV